MAQQSDWPSLLDWLPNGFDSWEAWVAIGTIGLALATAYLARQTRGEARATRKALQTGIRPLIVDAPLGVFTHEKETRYANDVRRTLVDRGRIAISASSGGEGGWVEVSVPLHNVGSGLALIQSAQLHDFESSFPWQRTTLQTAVPAGELTKVTFSAEIDPGDAAAIRDELRGDPTVRDFSVEVAYTDMDGEQSTRTRADIRGRVRWWRVTRVRLYSGDDQEPFADLIRQEPPRTS